MVDVKVIVLTSCAPCMCTILGGALDRRLSLHVYVDAILL